MDKELDNTEKRIMALILQSNTTEITLSSLSTPLVVKQLVTDIRTLVPHKRKIGLRDFYLFLPGSPLDCDIAKYLTEALMSAETKEAQALWNLYNADLQHEIIMPDAGLINAEIIQKLDIEGKEIRNAFLRKHSMLPPQNTPYTYTYGAMTAEDATELVFILKQVLSIKPYGKILIDEFFDEIDLRILYLYGMSEAEQYAKDDYDGGAFLQLTMESDDKLPEGVPLLSWLQEKVPDVFTRLRAELLNPLWSENRSFFWEGWLRQNKPEVHADRYTTSNAAYHPERDGMDYTDALDEILRNSENESD